MLDLLIDIGALKHPQRLEDVLLACEADARGRKGLENRAYPQAERIRLALRAAAGVDAARLKSETNLEGEALGRALRSARLQAVKLAFDAAPRDSAPGH